MIKGGFFLKSLKQLFIISLISCFILLGNSFVSAYNCNGGFTQCTDLEFGQIPSYPNGTFNGIVVDQNFNFNVVSSKYFLSQNGSKFNLYYWWQSDGLHYSSQYWDGSNKQNGKLNGYFYCNTNSFPVNGYSYYLKDISNCLYNSGFNSLKSNLNGVNYYGYSCGNSVSTSNCVVCLYDELKTKYICIDKSYTTVLGNSTLTTATIESLSIDNPFSKNSGTSFNPSTGSRLDGRLITSSGYTNSQMIEGYECVGLQPSLCYGGYPITDIFQSGENFEDFTGYTAGQGATIFDLYNRYSGSFSNINQFLNTVLTRYQNGQVNSFITEPKALLMLGAQMNTAGLKISYISTYCDLLLNKNNTSIYTGNSVDDLRAQSCYRSQHINDSLKTSDGSDIIGQGSDVGIFGSGEDVDFDPETFFSNMMEKISSGLDSVSTGTALGVIPGYIILFTLALIFIRMISH